MLLFQKRFFEGLVSGAVTVTFRRWEKPHVRPGGRYRCHPIGVLEVTAISRVRVAEISEDDARRSGFGSRAELVEYIRSGPGGDVDDDTEMFRVELHHGGDGDRVEIALDDQLSSEDVETISAKLARMDGNKPWIMTTLRLIEAKPRIAASKLAAELGRETLPFKVDVRKLKKLGLTQSFEIGYEISPRGRAYLAAAPHGPASGKSSAEKSRKKMTARKNAPGKNAPGKNAPGKHAPGKNAPGKNVPGMTLAAKRRGRAR